MEIFYINYRLKKNYIAIKRYDEQVVIKSMEEKRQKMLKLTEPALL
jgi:hypothetical protein